MANGGPFDCYPPGLRIDYFPPYPYGVPPERETSSAPHTVHVVPSIQEQMGTDPISKLAAAIEKLADALTCGSAD